MSSTYKWCNQRGKYEMERFKSLAGVLRAKFSKTVNVPQKTSCFHLQISNSPFSPFLTEVLLSTVKRKLFYLHFASKRHAHWHLNSLHFIWLLCTFSMQCSEVKRFMGMPQWHRKVTLTLVVFKSLTIKT